MALNLGPQAFDAVQALKNNSDWRIFVESLETQLSVLMHASLDVPPEVRVDATGYARGLRDTISAILMMEKPVRSGQQPKTRIKVDV